MSIRPATAEDAAAIAEIFLSGAREAWGLAADELPAEMEPPPIHGGELVAEDDDGIAGFAIVKDCEIDLALHAPARVGPRRRPRARSLAAEDALRAAPCAEVSLWTEERNASARRDLPGVGLAQDQGAPRARLERHRDARAAVPQAPLSAIGGAPRAAALPAVGLVVLAVTSLQVGAAFAVELFDELGPAGAAFGRLAFAALILVAIWRPRLRGRPRGDLRVAVAFGLALGAMNLCIYEAMDRIPLGVAVTFEFVGPLGVAVAGSRRALDLLWVVLAAAGIVLLADYGGGSLDPAGVAFALAAGVLWAAYIVLSQRTGTLFGGGSGLAVAMVAGAALVAPFGIADAGAELLRPELLGAILAVALASSVLPYSLELEALRRLPTRVFGVLMSLEPAVAALAGLVVLDQGLAARDWLAIGLVVIASAGASTLEP